MYQILEVLNKTSGITGSMVVGNDGIVIAADLNTQIEEETIGARRNERGHDHRDDRRLVSGRPLGQVARIVAGHHGSRHRVLADGVERGRSRGDPGPVGPARGRAGEEEGPADQRGDGDETAHA